MNEVPRVVCLDFETEAIVGNPLLDPPKPVGLAVRYLNGATEYVTDMSEMAFTYRKFTEQGEVLFHNAPFDMAVAQKWLGVDPPHWSKVHDTMYLLYLDDPYAASYSLKPAAERYLSLPPESQDAVKEWVLANVHKSTAKNWGGFICLAPEALVSVYAQNDVEITYKLFEKLYPTTQLEPYDRERALAPILSAATVSGVRVATPLLEEGLERYSFAFEQADNLLRTTLQAPSLNPSSSQQLAEALDRMGLVDEWAMTEGGQRSVELKSLRVKDPTVMNLLRYRSTLKTLISTFYTGWLEREHNGRLHPSWNSTRGDRDGGTRTGRLSSSNPNFQNIPNPIEGGITAPPGLPDLPDMRRYILPEEGHLWLKRDFDAQEIRVMAHFESGLMAQAFRQTPNLDPHELVREQIRELTGVDYPRKYVKETGFGILYGMGAATLGGRLGVRSNVALELIAAYKRAIPGVEKLQRGTKNRGRVGEPIRTWGGRLIYAEPARVIKGEYRSFEYKLLNYLIQGSSADQTKEAVITWNKYKDDAVFMATVHDEVCISAPEHNWTAHMEYLRYAMDDVCVFNVPMRSTGFVGTSWGSLDNE